MSAFGFFHGGIDDAGLFFISELLRPSPVFDDRLLRPLESEFAVRSARTDRRSRADRGARADAHRCHQHAAGSDEGAVFDEGRPLVGAVVIAGDAAGPDIDAAAYSRIAEIGQMVGLGMRADFSVFDLDEVSDMYLAV